MVAVTRKEPSGALAQTAIRFEKIVADFSKGTGDGSLLSWQNPEDVDVVATVLYENKTAGSAADTISVGVVANATGAGTNIITVGTITALGTAHGLGNPTGTGWRLWNKNGGADDFITGQSNSAGLGPSGTATGDIYIIYFPLT